jgi:isopenicillin N synthase-like dioxygenase
VLPDRRGDGGDASGSDAGAEVDEWIDVPSVAGGLLVNLGDVMRFWTNDAWKSTRHRVVARRETLALDRLSLIFFHMPNYDAVVDAGDFGAAVVNDARPRKYPAFKSGERSHFNQLMRDEEGLPDRQTLKEGTNARGD